MQTLCEVSVEAYLAAGNPFDVVSRPEVCAGCGGRDCFHRHCTYERWMGKQLVKVARFLCKLCRLTISMLPFFVLPYPHLSHGSCMMSLRSADDESLNSCCLRRSCLPKVLISRPFPSSAFASAECQKGSICSNHPTAGARNRLNCSARSCLVQPCCIGIRLPRSYWPRSMDTCAVVLAP